jgi:hypothetical protein
VALALLGWGLGHVAIGDRRGWLLLSAEAAALVALVGVGLPRIEGDAVNGLFLALVLFFAAWAGQAIDAHRRAERSGARPGGAIWLLALLPIAVVVFSGFWMVGGSAATASATMERYVDAWRHGRPEVADRLLVEPAGPSATATRWAEVEAVIGDRLGALAASLGPRSGLDLGHPFANLEFRLMPGLPVTERPAATARIVVVRHVSVRSSFLGLFPTAVQQIEVLDQIGTIELVSVPLRPAAGLGDWPATRVWRIVALDLERIGTP